MTTSIEPGPHTAVHAPVAPIVGRSHGIPPRGLRHTPRTKGFSGAFGRMFPELRAANFGHTDAENERNLILLGAAMASEADPADPKDGADDEESGIPALYTYFGQFVDHDLTFDPASSLQKQADPDALTDYRTPSFDLDNLYGRGPDDQPYLYQPGGRLLLLGDDLAGAAAGAHDLPRAPGNGRALIGDPRNDENSIVSQLQGLFQRFHNRMATDFSSLSFAEVQDEVRLHYQHVVLNDFLPRIVGKRILDALRRSDGRWDPGQLRYFDLSGGTFMPVEFATAAYRLGHSMVRPGYRVNDNTLEPIFPPPDGAPNPRNLTGLTGFKPMTPGWGIDWGRFIDIDTRDSGDENSPDPVKKHRLQFAYRIDTSLVNPLSQLPPSVMGSEPPPSLGARNLIRGWRLGLPSGQAVARRMGVKPLPDSEIRLGKAVDGATGLPTIDTVANGAFRHRCPLWTYILAEAALNQAAVTVPVTEKKTVTTPQLGPVGGRIVAETFVGLAHADKASLLHHPGWTPMKPDFALKDLVAYAIGS